MICVRFIFVVSPVTVFHVRLCDNEKALKALNECLPDRLKSDFFNKILKTTAGDDHITEQLLTRLRHIIAGHVKQTSDK